MHFPRFTVGMHTFLLFRFGRHSSVLGGLCMIQHTPPPKRNSFGEHQFMARLLCP